MALVVNLKSVDNLEGKADRIARCTFRDNTLNSKTVRSAKNVAYFGESFEWPVARTIEPEECIYLQFFNHNKYLSDKLIGSFTLSLQQVIQDGNIKLSEPLIDHNNRVTFESVSFEVQYYSPDGKIGDWNTQQFSYPLIEEIDDDQTRNKVKGQRYIPHALEETNSLRELDRERRGQNAMPGEDTISQTMMVDQMFQVKQKRPEVLEHEMHKPRDFSVSITIIEGTHFSGLDIDPVIRVQVGDQFRYTTIKKSTNNPFYNEYFVYDFNESPGMIFDKMITIRAMHSIGIPGRQVLRAGNLLAGRIIGEFKCDVGTVYAAPDHMYYHKWAVLINPKEAQDGPKGYIKCDISVLGKGDVVRAPKHNLKDDDTQDIEGNLLLPAGVPMERQRANYQMIIYRAEDLPRTNLGLFASVKKAMGGTPEAFIDAMVKVHFAGQVCKTSSKKHYHPEWRQVIVFSDMFPPLCNRIKVQLCDNDVTTDEVIATHFIELSQIMDPGSDNEGILPTFGPTWVNFYGAPRNYKMVDEHEDLNEGLGEGAAFRGRVLMQLKTEIQDGEMTGPSTVYREKLRTSSAVQVAPRRQFLLFGTFMEATMIDKDLKDNKIHFEVSIGQFGNVLDAKASKSFISDNVDDESDEELEEESRLLKKKKDEEADLPCQSTTEPTAPSVMTDKNYLYMPYEGTKPCVHVVAMFEDLRKRMYHSNLLENIQDIIDDGLEDVRQMVKEEHDSSHRRLRGVLGEFSAAIGNYLRLSANFGIGSGSGKTKLDKFRLKMCKTQLEKIKSATNEIKGKVCKDNVREKYRAAKDLARQVKHVVKEPQHSIPDVFVWMVSDKRRIAYSRIPAKELLFATQDDMLGKNCGKIQTVFLRKPGKKSVGSAGWVMQAKVDMYLWLGQYEPDKTIKEYMKGLPPGYEMTNGIKTDPIPPSVLVYPECHTFQLRSYLFQARSLLGSDDTGLSDPFARILISNHCKSSQVIEATLSPTWDETLVFQNIKVYGPMDHITKNPPLVICEVFDYDLVGKPEFLGRAFIKPKVKPADVSYDLPAFPTPLEWWDVYRGARAAGELLASFELLEGPDETMAPLPEVVPSKWKESIKIIPLPHAIKPTLSRHRVEALFWGIHEARRVQLLSVDRPKVYLEIGGKTIKSNRVEDIEKNCNFEDNVFYMDVDLPDHKHFWPPITMRVVDCRQFGREVLVGIHSVGDSAKYLRGVGYDDDEQKGYHSKAVLHDIAPQSDPNGNVPGEPGQDVVVDIDTPKSQLSALDTSSVAINMDIHNSTLVPVPLLGIPEEEQPPKGSVKGSRAGSVMGDVPAVKFSTTASSPPNGHVPGQTAGAGDPMSKDGEAPKKKKKKDLIAELDWWSKYYVTKEDLAKKEQNELMAIDLDDTLTQEEKEKKKKDKKSKSALTDSDEDLLDDNDLRDLFPNVVDYGALDEGQLTELRELADQKRKEEEDKTDETKNKKKNKKKKKSTMKSLKGAINGAFAKDAGDNWGDEKAVSEDDMEDKSHIKRITVYESELEKVRHFGGFEDLFETFPLHRGRLEDDEEDDGGRIVAKFKGNLLVYKIDEKDDDEVGSVSSKLVKHAPAAAALKKLQALPMLKLAQNVPSPKPFQVQVLVYVVKCNDLAPTDVNGKADPYLVVKCGKHEINDKANKRHNQLSPMFGKMFEFDAAFPMDCNLRVQVYDYDLLSSDDIIGETVIDLENRFHSKHRATCGIADNYELYGYNIWRDPQKPTQIVAKLCKDLRLDPPDYKATSVKCCGKTYHADGEVEMESGDMLPTQECLALELLNHWDEIPGGSKLVPEHIETRPLFSPMRPGVEQGRVEMWIDMFPKDMPSPTTTIDITPREPKDYELRVIIWNTDDVVLEDKNFLTGEASSDIMVKGYLKGMGEDDQQTDVHYRSLTGEGNFNWRFIFPFEYLKAEEKIVYKKRISIFDLEESEVKVPPKLTVQVWDADLISSDDFLGAITMDLNKIPRPAKDAKHCKATLLKKDAHVPCFNIFKQKRAKGWWPMVAKDDEGDRLVGKVEAELILMSAEDAEKAPAGLGRKEPDPIAEPKRPEDSFLWLMNPLKTLRYVIWRNYKWLILKLFLLALVILFIALLFYSMPGATIDKLYGLTN